MLIDFRALLPLLAGVDHMRARRSNVHSGHADRPDGRGIDLAERL
jgi:hypothetical protein